MDNTPTTLPGVSGRKADAIDRAARLCHFNLQHGPEYAAKLFQKAASNHAPALGLVWSDRMLADFVEANNSADAYLSHTIRDVRNLAACLPGLVDAPAFGAELPDWSLAMAGGRTYQFALSERMPKEWNALRRVALRAQRAAEADCNGNGLTEQQEDRRDDLIRKAAEAAARSIFGPSASVHGIGGDPRGGSVLRVKWDGMPENFNRDGEGLTIWPKL